MKLSQHKTIVSSSLMNLTDQKLIELIEKEIIVGEIDDLEETKEFLIQDDLDLIDQILEFQDEIPNKIRFIEDETEENTILIQKKGNKFIITSEEDVDFEIEFRIIKESNYVRQLLVRDNFTCYYCKEKNTDLLEIDHVYPLSKGGSNDAFNLITSCRNCNRRKSGSLMELDIINDIWKRNKELNFVYNINVAGITAYFDRINAKRTRK